MLAPGLIFGILRYVLKLIYLMYFSPSFTLFELCGAVFIMNSMIHLRKNSLSEYFKAISHYFRVYSLSGFISSTRWTHLSFSLLSWSSSRRFFGVKSSKATISSHLSNRALLCLQPQAAQAQCVSFILRTVYGNSGKRFKWINPR